MKIHKATGISTKYDEIRRVDKSWVENTSFAYDDYYHYPAEQQRGEEGYGPLYYSEVVWTANVRDAKGEAIRDYFGDIDIRTDGERYVTTDGYYVDGTFSNWHTSGGCYVIEYYPGENDKKYVKQWEHNYVFGLERNGILDKNEPNLKIEYPELYNEVMEHRKKQQEKEAGKNVTAEVRIAQRQNETKISTSQNTENHSATLVVAETKQQAQQKNVQKTEEKDIKIPNDYRCPISALIMLDPVTTSDGETYEREEIEKWFVSNDTSPSTKVILANKTLTPNNSLKRIISDFLDQHQPLRNSDQLYESKALELKLIQAIKEGKKDEVNHIVSIDRRLSQKPLTERNLTPLQLAAELKQPVLISALIPALVKVGYDFEKVDTDGNTVLLAAVKNKQFDAAKLLIANKVNLDACDNNKNTALHLIAAQQGSKKNMGLITLLLEAGANGKSLNAQGKRPSDVAREAGFTNLSKFIDDKRRELKAKPFLEPLEKEIENLRAENERLRNSNNVNNAANSSSGPSSKP